MPVKDIIFVVILIILFTFINDLILLKLYMDYEVTYMAEVRECYELMQELFRVTKEVNNFVLNQCTYFDDSVEEMNKKINDLYKSSKQ